jgi:hypothetical protein
MFSLIASIKEVRKDLFQDETVTASPIPLTMPPDLQRPIDFVEGIGEPTNACFLTKDDIDPTGWFALHFHSFIQ